MPGGYSRISEMLEEKVTQDNNVIRMRGRCVKIVPKFGDVITGVMIGEKRLYEYSRDNVFVIQVSEGQYTFISRNDISYITVNEAGIVTDKPFPENVDAVWK
jgi:hypothetical protein